MLVGKDRRSAYGNGNKNIAAFLPAPSFHSRNIRDSFFRPTLSLPGAVVPFCLR
jgi:hypothetical protein